jgi:hypothetical protein
MCCQYPLPINQRFSIVSIHAAGTNGEQLKWGTVGSQGIARLTIGFYNPL